MKNLPKNIFDHPFVWDLLTVYWQLWTIFLGSETKIGKVENFVEFKMFAVIVDFPLFCPTKISLGRFAPIFPWSRELIAAIKYQCQKIIFNKVPISIIARTLMSRISLKKFLLREFTEWES
jgi:hypothetical protein